MKIFISLVLLITLAFADDNACYKNSVKECEGHRIDSSDCNSLLSGHKFGQPVLFRYINASIQQSYNYLLLSTYYGNYVKNRPGFEKVLRELSDKAWSNAIELIKYINKRGGKLEFIYEDRVSGPLNNFKAEIDEIYAMARALDSEKYLTKMIYEILQQVTGKKELYDPALAHYIEEKFLVFQIEKIRQLSGYINDLKDLLNGNDASLALYIFDTYLQKQ